MNKQELIETTKTLIAAPSCCQPLKAAAQAWLEAVGTAGENAAAEAFLKELKDGTRSILISTHILSEVEELCDYVTMINHGTIIASGQVEGLVDRMIADREQKFHVRTLAPIPDGFRPMILGEPGVQDAEYVDPTHMTITFKGDYEQKADVYEFLFQNKLRIIGFSEEGGGLEDLYMELTNEEGEVNIK